MGQGVKVVGRGTTLLPRGNVLVGVSFSVLLERS